MPKANIELDDTDRTILRLALSHFDDLLEKAVKKNRETGLTHGADEADAMRMVINGTHGVGKSLYGRLWIEQPAKKGQPAKDPAQMDLEDEIKDADYTVSGNGAQKPDDDQPAAAAPKQKLLGPGKAKRAKKGKKPKPPKSDMDGNL